MSASKKELNRAQAIEKIAAHLLAHGLSQASLRQLAAAADISDRMLLYYFQNKDEVLAEALLKIAADNSAALQNAMPDQPKFQGDELLHLMSNLSRRAEFAPYMRLWMECIGAASQGREPFATLSGPILLGFQEGIENMLAIEDATDRKKTAAMILVMIDGLTLMDRGHAPQISDDALDGLQKLLST